MTSPLPIDKVLADPRLLGAELGDIGTWSTWFAVLKAAFALPLTEAERKTFAAISGGRVPPLKLDSQNRCAPDDRTLGRAGIRDIAKVRCDYIFAAANPRTALINNTRQ